MLLLKKNERFLFYSEREFPGSWERWSIPLSFSIANIMLYIYRIWRSRREIYKGNRRTWHLRFITSALHVGLGSTRDTYQPDKGVICRDINWRKHLLGHLFLFSVLSISHIYLWGYPHITIKKNPILLNSVYALKQNQQWHLISYPKLTIDQKQFFIIIFAQKKLLV